MSYKLTKQSDFVSFDGSVLITTEHQRPDRYRHLDSIENKSPLIARGGGYSYSAASFGEKTLVQEMVRFNRFLAFDSQMLTVKVESGMRLIELLTWAIERKLYFPVIPGYPLITVGGCVAADVHGKNPHRDGTFSDWVKQLTVFHPDKGYQVTSQDVVPELFALTCGGFGLTGIITDVTLQLVPLPSNHVVISEHPVQRLEDAVELLSKNIGDFSYSWHDGTSGSQFGKGIVFSGSWGRSRQSNIILTDRYVTAESRGNLPFSFWNPASVRMANLAFRLKNKFLENSYEKDILSASFPFASNTLYHKLFGRKGLREAQILISEERIVTFLRSFEKLVMKTKAPVSMISIKGFKGCQESLSLTGSGFIVAIDCYVNGITSQFFRELDKLMVSENGQPSLSKDSRLPFETAKISIKHYQEFKEALKKYDPPRLFRSELSERIGV